MVRVVFLHPDLGIGGAERLIVDCSLALQSKDHETLILTAHHDPRHCFRETINGQCPVISKGDWLPRSFFGRCQALCASLRMIYLALYLFFSLPAELVIVDQVSTPLLLLKIMGFPTIFYCHYPDMLLSTNRIGLKHFYRLPLDWLEEFTTGMADIILVNSNFTKEVFKRTFSRLRNINPAVLYPSLPTKIFQEDGVKPKELHETDEVRFLSLNRYERKKDIGLAIRSLALLGIESGRLAIAGGYDPRVTENVEHYRELVELARDLGVEDRVTFLRSPTDAEKVWLLKHCSILLYTPAGEHFGIVPLEAMYCNTPVLAVDSGGPLETVQHGETGWLVEPQPGSWAQVMQTVGSRGSGALLEMGVRGRDRVEEYFSFPAFTQHLVDYVLIATSSSSSIPVSIGQLFSRLALAFHFGLAVMLLFWMVFYTPLP